MIHRLVCQFKMLICEWLLGIIISLCPNNAEGHMLLLIIKQYFEAKVKEHFK